MTILVTGVAGFIGSHVAEALLGRGDSVVGIDNLDAGDELYPVELRRENLAAVTRAGKITFVESDVRDLDTLRHVMRDHRVERVIHLAARSGVRASAAAPLEYAGTNVAGTAAVLQAAHECGVGGVVFASSSSVYGARRDGAFLESDATGEPASPYAATKRAGELLCHAMHCSHGLATLCLRLFTVYGPRQRPNMAIHRFVRQLEAGVPLTVFGDGDSARDYTFVEDAVAGMVAAVDNIRGFDVINLGSGRALRLADLIRTLEGVTGRSAEIDRAPVPSTDVPYTRADVRKAEQQLGWVPRTTFDDGVAQFVSWFRGR